MLLKGLYRNKNEYNGQLSKADIIREIKNKTLIIQPLIEKDGDYPNIKSASFDISPSCLIMSVKQGRFVRIYSSMSRCEKGHRVPDWHCKTCRSNAQKTGQLLKFCVEQKYIYIGPRDTVLVLSKEYLQLPENICGNVFSRVSTVSSGLGHISTTIDPLWKGALLIAISNPSSEPIKLMIEDADASSVPLATVTLQYLNTPVERNHVQTTHLPARVDILEKYLYNVDESKSRSMLIKNAISRFTHMKDYNLTVDLIKRLKDMKDIAPEQWNEELKALEKEVCAQKIKEKKWKCRLLSIFRLLQKFLSILLVCLLAKIVYPVITGEGPNTADFTAPMIIAVVECILGFLTYRKE